MEMNSHMNNSTNNMSNAAHGISASDMEEMISELA